MSHLPSLRICKQAARPNQSYESNELHEAQRDRLLTTRLCNWLAPLQLGGPAVRTGRASFSQDSTITTLGKSAAMSDWLSEHTFEIGLVAGVLGLVLTIGIAVLDFV